MRFPISKNIKEISQNLLSHFSKHFHVDFEMILCHISNLNHDLCHVNGICSHVDIGSMSHVNFKGTQHTA